MTDYRKNFKQRIHKSLANPNLQTALDNNAARRKVARSQAYSSLPVDLEIMKDQAHAIRQETLNNFHSYLAEFIRNLQSNGMIVHRAANAQEAQEKILQIAKTHQAKLVAKSKSMVSEEIHTNQILEQAGIRSVETDLGEFIVQLRNEPSAHIITPAVHLRREDVADTFVEKLGMPYTTDVKVMCDVARKELREIFLNADIGLSGVNLGIAEAGVLCLLTNEGNGRMVTTVPRVHIALMGIERLVPTWNDLAVILQLLSRSATGQKLTNYVSLIRAGRQTYDFDGPFERHVILLDNGRSEIAQSPIAESLFCIRCGACLNVCPVFRELGGHAYASPYPGPIGSLVSPYIFGLREYGHLSKASTLCGACNSVCPVKIDFTSLLLRVRDQYIQQTPQPWGWRLGMKFYAWVVTNAWVYRLGIAFAALGTHLLPHKEGWLRVLPPPAAAWTKSRDFPRFSQSPFRKRFTAINQVNQKPKPLPTVLPKPVSIKPDGKQPTAVTSGLNLTERFSLELQGLGGEFFACRQEELAEKILAKMQELKINQIIPWNHKGVEPQGLIEQLNLAGVIVMEPGLPENAQRQAVLNSLSRADAGITGVTAALADTGTLILAGGAGKSQLASLLPPIHIAVLRDKDIYASFSDWLLDQGKEVLSLASSAALISGPSRTADIEMTLTIGVHGPGQVIVFCYET